MTTYDIAIYENKRWSYGAPLAVVKDLTEGQKDALRVLFDRHKVTYKVAEKVTMDELSFHQQLFSQRINNKKKKEITNE
jgi:hypothetical protein